MNQEVSITDGVPVPGAILGADVMVFDEDATRGDIIYSLSQHIPQNEFGLPEFFIRSDLISGYQVAEDEIDAASVGLNYFEGFPTLPNGAAFWNQLPHEPQKSFELFVAYLDQVAEIGIRQLDMLAAAKGESLENIAELSKEFYWTSRARAYDMFIVAAEAKKRQHRIRKMENTHFEKTQALFDQLLSRFINDGEDSWIDELDAKEAIEVLETLVKIQRMSVGLTGQHASSTAREFTDGESSQDMLRKIAQNAGANHSTADKFASQLQALLSDPNEGAVIQAAVIKMTAPNNKTAFQEDM